MNIAALQRRIIELEAECDELRKAYSSAAATDIMSRGAAYQAGLVDAGYKACEICKVPCIPTCVACDESKWEKTSQVYFDENVKLRERLKNAATMLGFYHVNGRRCLASLENPCSICTFIEAGKDNGT